MLLRRKQPRSDRGISPSVNDLRDGRLPLALGLLLASYTVCVKSLYSPSDGCCSQRSSSSAGACSHRIRRMSRPVRYQMPCTC